MKQRQYFIDWIRVIAIGLLLIYHTAICFQPWGGFVGFITHHEPWTSLWIPMTMLNVWRIPIVFFISGMGYYLAIQNRTAKELLIERLLRIGVPLLFGSLAIVPIHWWLLQSYYQREIAYLPGMGHLWFLGNILLYVVMLSPLIFFFKKRSQNSMILFIKQLFGTPISLFLMGLVFVTESLLIQPVIYELYAFTLHGLVLGLLAFLLGMLMMAGGAPFWKMLMKWKWIFLISALLLFTSRTLHAPIQAAHYLLAIESNCWVFTVLAFACRYLNHNSRLLTYLKDAAYPVYIIHMVWLYAGASFIFHMHTDATIKFILLVCFTCSGSMVTYELLIKRTTFLRLLFGLKTK
jgi:peptidoglycan/LPS O-acetylase OafA/YrhL